MITVAIPFHKGFGYLAEAIASVERQTTPDWSLLVVDNCGEPDDQATAFMARYTDPRIRHVRNESNLGMAGNFNRCLDLATTGLVTLLHSDDALEPEYCARMLRAGVDYPDATAFFCRASAIDADGQPIFSFPDHYKEWTIPTATREFAVQGEAGAAAIVRGNFIMAPTLCYRRSKLGAHRFTRDWLMVLDLELYMRLITTGHVFVGLPGRDYRYRRHGANATTQFTATLLRFDEEVRIYDQLADQFRALGWKRASRIARRKTVIGLNLLYCAANHFARLEIKDGVGKLRFLQQRLLRWPTDSARPSASE